MGCACLKSSKNIEIGLKTRKTNASTYQLSSTAEVKELARRTPRNSKSKLGNINISLLYLMKLFLLLE